MKRKDHPFWPHHVIEQAIQAVLIIAVILTMALLLPTGIEEKADPVTTPEHVKPEWYFLAMYQSLKLIPRVIGIVGMVLAVAALFEAKEDVLEYLFGIQYSVIWPLWHGLH